MTQQIDTDNVQIEPESHGPPPWASWATALAVTTIGVILLVGALGIPERAGQPLGPSAFPAAVGVLALGVGLTLIGQQALARRRSNGGATSRRIEPHSREVTKRWLSLGGIVAVVITYTFLLQPVGYLVSTVAFFVAVCWLIGSRSPLRDLAIGAGITLVIYYGFNGLLGVRLPGGILDLGI